jgi:hypothetical protein
MATYRQVQTAFWQDDFVLQLTPEEKYFYLYLLTNSKTKQCGIYQLPMQVIILETGYNQETAEKLLKRFVEYGKVIYNSRTREIGIVNWLKYNPMESPKTRVCVERELKEVKDKSLIGVIYPDRYPLQGVSQEEKEKEKEKEKAEAEEEEKEESTRELTPAASAAVELFAEGNNEKSNNPPPQGAIPPTSRSRLFVKGEFENSVTDETTKKEVDEFREIVDNYGDYKCKSVQMQGEMLLNRVWNKLHPNPEEIRLASGYIKTFGFGEVEIAFSEAVKYDKKKLAYVEIVLKKRKERRDLIDKKERERQKRLEQEQKIEEQKKAGVGLGLLKKVYGDDNKFIAQIQE